MWLPAHIYVDRCTTLKDAMAQCGSPRDALHDLFTICQNLTKQLQMQHRRSICLRDLNSRNIVRANVGTNKSWTLLEYCNTQRAGTKIDSMPAWSCTPEVRARARFPRQFSCALCAGAAGSRTVGLCAKRACERVCSSRTSACAARW